MNTKNTKMTKRKIPYKRLSSTDYMSIFPPYFDIWALHRITDVPGVLDYSILTIHLVKHFSGIDIKWLCGMFMVKLPAGHHEDGNVDYGGHGYQTMYIERIIKSPFFREKNGKIYATERGDKVYKHVCQIEKAVLQDADFSELSYTEQIIMLFLHPEIATQYDLLQYFYDISSDRVNNTPWELLLFIDEVDLVPLAASDDEQIRHILILRLIPLKDSIARAKMGRPTPT